MSMADSDVNITDSEANVTDSELHMECVEEDLTPWQQQPEEEMEETSKGPSKVPAPPDDTSVIPLSDGSSITTKPMPALAPLLPKPMVLTQAMTQVLQPFQTSMPQVLHMPTTMLPSTGSTTGQNIIFTTQNIQGDGQTISAKPVGYILNGQPITVLPGGQGTQLQLSPQQVLSQPRGRPGTSGFTTVRIPVTLTIRTTNGVQTISTVASGGVTLSSSPAALPTTIPSVTGIVSASSSGAAGSHVVRTAPLTVAPKIQRYPTLQPAPSSTRSPATSGPSTAPSPRAPLRVIAPATAKPKMCKRCGSEYKLVNALRGFMCLCSKQIALSLDAINAAAKLSSKPSKSSRSKSSKATSSSSSFSKTSKEPPTTPGRPVYPEEEGSPILKTDQQGKLIMLVEDFYYGVDKGRSLSGAPVEKPPGVFKCIHCEKTLKTNIKLMNHMRHHVEMTAQQNGEVDTHTACQHCFRNLATPFRLQCHVESVHSQLESTAKCKICEWAYESEPVFLQHMKSTHKPGEMPYICQVCDYRSSLYVDVFAHFREVHNGTANLLCPYCLKLFRSSSNYQNHYSRHQKKTVFQCDRCRLQFLFAKDRAEHKVQYHKTHLKPRQLEGLKPGTKVTIRAYALQGKQYFHQESSGRGDLRRSKVIDVPSAPQKPEPKKKPVESLMELLTKFQMSASLAQQNCMECAFKIPHFANHFPTYVHCSLCRYCTCCSRAYANHMINNHVTRKSTTQYLAMYESYPRMDEMRCTSCNYKTKVGDMMANHLVDHPDHDAASFNKLEVEVPEEASQSFVITEISPGQGGSFVPIHLLPAGNSSTQLSIKPLISSKPSMTITVLGPNKTMPSTAASNGVWTTPKVGGLGHVMEPQAVDTNGELFHGGEARMGKSRKEGATKLAVRQLKVLLYALCSGFPQASLRFGTQPELIQDWMLQLENQRLQKDWIWSTDRIAEWVMCQREQQLPVTEENLLQTATQALEESHEIGEFYEWAVEFMLRHNLGLQATCSAKRPLPRNVYESVRIFTRFVCKQVKDVGFRPPSIGCVDELSVFLDLDKLKTSPEAFQLIGTGEPLIEVVLAGLADGTMLPTMVFLKGNPPHLHKAIPDSVFLEVRPEGFTDNERLQLWLSKVWQKHVNPQAGGKGLLIMDTHHGHLANDFLAALNSSNTLPAVIPIGCSCRLQPLELCVVPVMKEFLQARWCEMHTQNEGAVALGPGDLALLLVECLGDVVSCLATQPKILQQSFMMVSTPPQEEGEEGPAELAQSLTEALVGLSQAKLAKRSSEVLMKVGPEDKGVVSDTTSEYTLPSPPPNPQTLKQVFEKDSDLESFHGFEETEIDNLRTRNSQ
uniref:Pogo transposable element derived with ZNF domain a n=1 Tax=Hucho hucho TaxID=62062 RepID=A0A4W5R9Z6_9TELE